jgi:hypothetical protein
VLGAKPFRRRFVEPHRVVDSHSVYVACALLRDPAFGDVVDHATRCAFRRRSVAAAPAADGLDSLAIRQDDLRAVQEVFEDAVEAALAMPGTADEPPRAPDAAFTDPSLT